MKAGMKIVHQVQAMKVYVRARSGLQIDLDLSSNQRKKRIGDKIHNSDNIESSHSFGN